MRKTFLLFVAFATQVNFAQSVFPTDGSNVGIGTLSPVSKLHVVGTITSYEPIALSTTVNSYQLINSISGNVGDNTLINKLWTYRDGTLNNWFNARLHDGISIDASFKTPNLDTKTWWERDPKDNIQSWGNDAVTYLTINQGNVGIGSISPVSKLSVIGSLTLNGGLTNSLQRPSINAGTLTYGEIRGFSNSTNLGDDGFLRISAGGGTNSNTKSYIDLSGYSTIPDMNRNIVFGTFGLERMRVDINGNIGIGTTNPLNKLDVNGTIHSKEVKVDMLGWSDFVFKKEYQLPTLEEVEKHIAEKGHLENIPSEEEVLKDGINLGEMDSKLLQKIEELTLYMIEMKKENEKVKDENILLKKNQLELEKRIVKLEDK
ncbi:hypothetical protein SAMN05444671_3865 [Flavobacterium sp. CF108]|uniref:hypothetical protein n=1 Tax=unclassified Flavobacterium TaxID=196869 RepID=UPI0008C97FB0|nr:MULTISPECIES: hypothetical protein [unclassified Flavobacterium]SEO96502.1 hypothetical protein SAMN04487978_4106 [Flavobacterium sp. fv08]SHH81357.1 hypothetical protein SAMN05444671_3865 [Flavobacterium sp. CF108]